MQDHKERFWRHAHCRGIYVSSVICFIDLNFGFGFLLEIEMRIVQKHPEVDWQPVWRNIHTSRLTNTTISIRYAAIHDILPSNDRLAAVHLVPKSACSSCQNQDSVLHRITECSDGPLQWTWTKQKLSRILRIDYKRILKEWTIYPDIRIWPPQHQTAVLWILGQFVSYRIQKGSQSSLRDFTDFTHRAKWKLHQTTARPNVGRYLEVLEQSTTTDREGSTASRSVKPDGITLSAVRSPPAYCTAAYRG